MANLIQFRFEGADDIWQRLTGAEKTKVANDLTRICARKAADVAIKRMKLVLKPGHQFRVGASGKASENFGIQEGASGSRVTVDVVEGGSTIANAMIRQGIQPGTFPPLGVLRMWATEKGIDLALDDPETDSGYQRVSGYTTNSGIKRRSYMRRIKKGMGNRRKEDSLFALAMQIKEHGSYRPSSDWMTYTPKSAGRGRFDYVAYTLKQDYYFNQVVLGLKDAALLYADWLASGQKPSGGRTFTGGTGGF